jgi:hypothetical protein
VYTVDAARSWARTVAVRQGRIVHVANPSKALLDRITPDRPALLVTAVDLVSRLLPERTDSELGMGLDRALPLGRAGHHGEHGGVGLGRHAPRLCGGGPRWATHAARRRGGQCRAGLHGSRKRGPATGRVASSLRHPASPAIHGKALRRRRDRVGHRGTAGALSRPEGRCGQAHLSAAGAGQRGHGPGSERLAGPRPCHRGPRERFRRLGVVANFELFWANGTST